MFSKTLTNYVVGSGTVDFKCRYPRIEGLAFRIGGFWR